MTLCNVLFDYTSTDTIDSLIEELACSGLLWVMADQNNMSECDMIDWIIDHLNYSTRISVFATNGPSGVWPVMTIRCDDLSFKFDCDYSSDDICHALGMQYA